MKNLIQKIDFFIYGEALLEATTLDMLLTSYSDGKPRPAHNFFDSDAIPYYDLERKANKLIDDGLLKKENTHYIITSNGKLHLDKAGFVAVVKQSKRVSISYWLSISAFLISFFSFIRTIFDF